MNQCYISLNSSYACVEVLIERTVKLEDDVKVHQTECTNANDRLEN